MPSANAGLPAAALWFSFLVSLLVSIAALSKLRPSSLDLLLTRETFFRVLTTGENVFANAVLLARNGAVLVESAELHLKKIDGSPKQFPLSVVYVGEKVRSTNIMAEHFFYSSSPLDVIAGDTTKRVLYLGQMRDYAAFATSVSEDFEKWLASYKADRGLGMPNAKIEEEKAREIVAEIEPKVRDYVSQFMSVLQIEGGEYTLTLRIRYRDPAYFLRFTREAASSVAFRVASDIKERFRDQIRTALMMYASATLDGQVPNVAWPTYAPVEVKEL